MPYLSFYIVYAMLIGLKIIFLFSASESEYLSGLMLTADEARKTMTGLLVGVVLLSATVIILIIILIVKLRSCRAKNNVI